jgi:nucleoside-diphosphate-sugar epimerase
MNILLTGSSGFLGRNLLQNLSHELLIKTLSKSTGNYKVELDKCIPKFEDSFDLVIHAAGLVNFKKTQNINYDNFHKVNVIGTENLLKGLENTLIPKKFVHISTVAVYGKLMGNSIDENTELNASDPYGKSKIHAEQLVLNWCMKYNVICTILRLPLVVAPHPPGHLGSMINSIRKGFYFNIAGGKAKKSMVLASDIANYILKASDIGGIYNLTDGHHPSFFELSNNFSIQLGKSRPRNVPLWFAKVLAFGGNLIGESALINSTKLDKIISDLTFNDNKARAAFGWDPMPVLEGFKISDN